MDSDDSTSKDDFDLPAKLLLAYIKKSKSIGKTSVIHEIQGSLNKDILQKSIADVVDRHQLLRLCYDTQTLRFSESTNHEFIYYESVTVNEFLPLLKQVAAKPFNKVCNSLLRTTLIQNTNGSHYLITELSHLISDVLSFSIYFSELKKTYHNYKEKGQEYINPMPCQFIDVLEWQDKRNQSNQYNTELDYWHNQFSELPPILNLPIDFQRSSTETYTPCEIKFVLTGDILQNLQDFATSQRITLHSFLFSVYALLLYKYTHNEMINIGTQLPYRPMPFMESVIGNCTSTLIVKTEFNSEMNFLDLIHQISIKLEEGKKNQDVSIEDFINRFHPVNESRIPALFNARFNLLENTDLEYSLCDTNWLCVELNTGFYNDDIYFECAITDMGIKCSIKYNGTLFKQITAELVSQHIQNIVKSTLASPKENIKSYKLYDVIEHNRLFYDLNQTHFSYDSNKPFISYFEDIALNHPFRLAAQCGQCVLTYAELNDQSNQLAHYMLQQHVTIGEKVGVCIPRSMDMLIAILAVAKVGAVYIPLDPTFPKDRLAFVCADAAINILITTEEFSNLIEPPTEKKILLDRDKSYIKAEKTTNTTHSINGSSLAYILYTSGSTGMPKGVAIPHRALINHLLSMTIKPGFTSSDRLLAVTTLSFDIAGLELYLPLINGGMVVIATEEEKYNGKALAALVNLLDITVMQATPATWQMMFDSGWSGSPNLSVLCGGEALKPELAKKIMHRCKSLWNMYGPTETTIWSSTIKLEKDQERITIGKPINNTVFYILNEARELVATGEIGELYVGGDGLADGYHNRDDLTKEKFIFFDNQRLFKTADAARYLSDGSIEHLGRLDNQVKIRGYRIELGDIESQLLHIPGVRKSVVLVRDDLGNLGPTLVAYMVTDREILSDEFKSHLNKVLPEFMHPAFYMSLPELPLTPNLKINTKALPKPDLTATSLIYKKPENDTQTFLLAIWSNVLSREQIGVNDNFFDIGGNSLLATQVLNEIEAHYPGKVDIVDLFRFTTIEMMANYLKVDTTTENDTLVPVTLDKRVERALKFREKMKK